MSASEMFPPQNHVFVDFENVQEVDPSIFQAKLTSFTLFLGAQQTKLEVALVEVLLTHAATVQLVRLTAAGKNAVDFALAYYLGRAAVADPTGYFHIVSKDTGFDPLIAHLRSNHVKVRRHDSFATVTFGPPPKAASTLSEDPKRRAVELLQKNRANLPRKRDALVRHLQASSGNSLNAKAVEQLIKELQEQGQLSFDDKNHAHYHW